MLTRLSIVPRQLSGTDESAPWPSSSAHVSFAGPIDLDTFRIKYEVWPETLINASVFVRFGSYLQPENDRPPHKGVPYPRHFPLGTATMEISARVDANSREALS